MTGSVGGSATAWRSGCAPNSGEQDDQTAPIEAVASTLTIASGMLGRTAFAQSPRPTPDSPRTSAARATSARRSAQPRRRFQLVLALVHQGGVGAVKDGLRLSPNTLAKAMARPGGDWPAMQVIAVGERLAGSR